MHVYVTPQRMEEVKSFAVAATAVNIPINGRNFMIANNGAQPAYIDPSSPATTGDFLIPANTVLPQVFTCLGNLSVISNVTGTTISIMYLDI